MADVLDLRPVLPLGLDVDLPLAAKAVEIVDEAATEEALQRLVDVIDVDPLLEHLVAVDLDEALRYGRPEGRRHAGQLGTLACRLDELVGVLGEELDVLAGTVLENEGRSARGADARNRWWRERKADGAADPGQLLIQRGLDRRVLFLRLLARRPLLERDEEESAVGILNLAQHAEADDRGRVLDPRHLQDQFLSLAGDFACALQRGAVRQLYAGKDVALVFVGQEAARDDPAEQAGGSGQGEQEKQADHTLANGDAADTDITGRQAAEDAVEAVVELLQGTASTLLRLEQQCAERRAQGERIERRDDHRDGDGDGKLLVKLTRDAGNESGGNEDRRQNDGDRNHWAGYFLHRLERCLARRKAVLDVLLDRFDDDDRIVDDKPDGKDQAEE